MLYIAKISRAKFDIWFFYMFKDVPIEITQDIVSKCLNLDPELTFETLCGCIHSVVLS